MQIGLFLQEKNIPERITDIYISVMLFIFPLFTGFSGYANITFSKYLFFVIISLIWLVSLLFFSPLCKSSLRLKASFWIPCSAFILACIISAFFSEYFRESIIGAGRYNGLVTQLLCAAVFLGIAASAKLKPLHIRLCGVSASVCCVIAVFQLFNINIFGLFPNNYSYYDAHIKYTGEFLGTMGNVDILSAYLCMCIPVFFSVLMQTRSRFDIPFVIPLFLSVFTLTAASTAAGFVALGGWALIFIPGMCRTLARFSRALILSAVILLAAALALSFNGSINDGSFFFTFTISGYVAALVGLAFVCTAVALIIKKWLRSCDASPRALIYLGAATTVCLALIFVWGYTGTQGTLYEFSQILHGNFDDSFGSSRILIWRTVLKTVSEKPFIGHGPDTLPLIIDIGFSRYVPQTGETLSTFVDNAHNIYLGYLADIGIVGLAAFLLTVFSTLMSAHHLECAALLPGAVTSYLIHGFFGLGLSLVSPIFWLFLGLCAANNNHIFSEE